MPKLIGSFLVASPGLEAPPFSQSVVLLLQHRKKGAFGLVVNRPGPDNKGLPFTVFDGGPCAGQGLLLLHGHPEWAGPSQHEKQVTPGIFVGDYSCLKRVSDPSALGHFRFRVFTGFACWSAGQLEAELVNGIWRVLPASPELLFDYPVEELWDHLSPPRLPVFSMN